MPELPAPPVELNHSGTPPATILYSPGINEFAGQGVLDGFAERIARTLDHLDPDIPAVYAVKVVASEPYSNGGAFAEVREIVRRGARGNEQVTHRIYNLDYAPLLDSEQTEKNLATQALAVARVWAWMASQVLRRFPTVTSLGKSQKLALFVGGCALLLLLGYLVLLVVAVVEAVLAPMSGAPEAPAAVLSTIPPPPAWFTFLRDGWSSWLMRAGVVIGVLGLTFESVRTGLHRLVRMILAFCRYIEGGRGRAACTGRFHDLLEHILERQPSGVDVVAYSMGSLVALDALFPEHGSPQGRDSHIRSLTTIGCPFDLVRTFWPDYFANRRIPTLPPAWINVYSPVDLLGSNFNNDTGEKPVATRGINAANPVEADLPVGSEALIPTKNLGYDHAGRKQLDLTDALFGGAFLAHSQYWVLNDARAESCFGLVVPEIYPPSNP